MPLRARLDPLISGTMSATEADAFSKGLNFLKTIQENGFFHYQMTDLPFMSKAYCGSSPAEILIASKAASAGAFSILKSIDSGLC